MDCWSTFFVDDERTEGRFPVDNLAWSRLVTNYLCEGTDTPIPWERDLMFGPDAEIGDFTTLTLDPTGKLVEEKTCELVDVFEALLGDKLDRPRRILIMSDSNFGNTMLCKRMVRDWMTNRDYSPDRLSGDTLFLCYNLRYLNEDSDLNSELLNFVRKGRCPLDPKSFGDDLKQYGDRTVLLLDGYDELQPSHQEELQQLLIGDTDSCFGRASVVLTTGTDVEPSLLSLFGGHFVLHGVSEVVVEEAARKRHLNPESNAGFTDFKHIIQNRELSPVFLGVMCYLQRLDGRHTVRAMENAMFQCALEEHKKAYPGEESIEGKAQRHQLSLGKLFMHSLVEKKCGLAEYCLPNEFDLGASAELLRNVFRESKIRTAMKCNYNSILEVIADHYVEDFWYTVPEDRIRYFPILHSFEIFVYRDSPQDVSFKVIGENRGVGYYVWDFLNGPYDFNTYLCRAHIPRQMGDCLLNVTFVVPFTKDITQDMVMAMMYTLFPRNRSLQFLSRLLYNFDISAVQLNFMINEDFPLCPSVVSLVVSDHPAIWKVNHWKDLRDAAYEITLTFLGRGCGHDDVTMVLDNLMGSKLTTENETTTAAELLNLMKKYNKVNGYVCPFAVAASTGRYYLLHTKSRAAFEDLRPWRQRVQIEPNYSWEVVDLFVVTYQSLLNEPPTV